MKKKTDFIAQHLLWRGLYFFSVLLINIGIARFFAAEKSGQIFYIVNNLSLIIIGVSISLESGASFYVASGKIGVMAMARFCLIWAVGASGIALGVWWIFRIPYSNPDSSGPFFILSGFLFVAGVLLTSYFTALSYALRKFGLPNKILSTINVLFIFLMIFGRKEVYFRNHFLIFYFSVFFIQGIALTLFFFSTQDGKHDARFPSGAILNKVLKYSLVALLANVLYFLVNRADYWFVQYYCSARDLGNYIQASKMGQMLLILPSILGATLFPIFSSGNSTENPSELASVMRLLLWINGIICLLIISAGWFIFPFLFGPSFSSMYLLFVLLIPGILSFTMNYPLAAWFSAGNRMGINIRGTLLALVVICSGDWLFLPKYGVWFAPFISSAGYFCYYCYAVHIYRKAFPVPWNEFFLIRKSDIIRISSLIRKNFRLSSATNPVVSNRNI